MAKDDATSSKDVDKYLATLAPDARAALESLREIIRKAAPSAVEKIGYGVPMFYYKNSPLVSFAAAKSHCSFFVQSPAVMEEFVEQVKDFDTAKGTIRFQPAQPVPAALVTKLVQARMAETDAKKKK